MKVAVIGAGAMGCLFASKLKGVGNDVLLVDHDERTVEVIARNGVRVRERGRTRKVSLNIRKSAGDLRRYELVIVLVKAYNTKNVAKELRGRLDKRAVVLTLQNGLGNLEALSHLFGNRVVGGSTTEASLRIGPGVIEHTGRGLTVVGELDGRISERISSLASLFKGAGFRTTSTRSVRSVVWSKVLLNCAINPVSALTRLRNGELIRIGGMKRLMIDILDEGVRVAKAERVPIRVAYLSHLLSRVLRSTAMNRSSMLQDVLNGRQTEVRELNGAVAGLGQKRRISTPLNVLLTSLILGLENSYQV